ncbi:amidohydrolase family protein [Streptomyces sp. NPDC002519]
MTAADLLIRDADLVVTMDEALGDLPGGWVAVTGGVITGLGTAADPPPPAQRVVDASGCLVTPGLVNSHQHLYQNLTRSGDRPDLDGSLEAWFWHYFGMWSRLDEEAVRLSTAVGMAELAWSGCTTTVDHLYVHPKPGLLDAQIDEAARLGLRFTAVRGTMTLGERDGGICPDHLAEDEDAYLADCERLVARHHDPAPSAMIRIALGPTNLLSCTPSTMTRTAELADRLAVRLHTHVADDPEEHRFVTARYGRRPLEVLDALGWLTARTWCAHVVYPSTTEMALLAGRGVGVSHCPSSTVIGGGLPGGPTPVREMLDAGIAVGIGCDGATAADHQSLWMETKTAMLLARLRGGTADAMPAREALWMATRGGARAIGRDTEIGVLRHGACGDLAVWRMDTLPYAGALADPVTALFHGGPTWAWHTIVGGRFLVENGELRITGLDETLRRHREAARRIQAVAGPRG